MPHFFTSKAEHWQIFILKRNPHFINIINRDKNTLTKWSLNVQINPELTKIFIIFRYDNTTKRGTNCMQEIFLIKFR
ncbi:hypothetical protein E1A91_D13G218600v1 [Gossypium mustelinum]|uniref:Uncharacterized protein n=1 Tax=Gossypium mustelinum TaxID=34275 RepID=A0A5D2S4M5_GOSMU|nr:hypothetical protein E1A91_D13G218600v1 [Gossypium mustelinum]